MKLQDVFVIPETEPRLYLQVLCLIAGVSKVEAGSIITVLATVEDYPPIVRLGLNSLKITKSDFREKLREVIKQGKIT